MATHVNFSQNRSVNKHDKQSTVRRVPFGARVDTSRLCQFISLAPPPKNLTRAIIVTEMNKEAYEKDKINIEEYFREIFREVNVTKRAAKFLNFQKFPAQTFDQIPKDLKNSLGWWAFENNVTKYPDVMGVGMAYNWIFANVFNLIDSGGVYRVMNAVRGESGPPKFSDQEAEEMFNLNQGLIKEVFEATIHPKFVRDLADKFIKEVMSLEDRHGFIGLHFRFNPGDFFASDFLKRDEYANAGNHMHKTIIVHIHRSLSRPGYSF